MQRSILDSSVLIRHWRRCRARTSAPLDRARIQNWAEQLINHFQSNALVTPVAIEFIAGFTHRSELDWAVVFLERFTLVDKGNIPASDWNQAMRSARRVPRDGKPRQLGDCLIRAIAKRLRYEVQTWDQGFPR